LTVKYRQAKFSKYKPRVRRRINISSELKKLLKKEVTSGVKDMLKSGDFFKMQKNSPFSFIDRQNNRADKRGGAFNAGKMEFDIDRMVAESLMRGRRTSGVLKTIFGLVPSLIGR